LVGNPSDAAEIVNDVFVSVWDKRNTLELDDSLKAYMFQAVKNRSINHHKKVKPITTKLEYAKKTSSFTADGPLLEKDQQKLLLNLLNQLPPKCKQVFVLNRIDGFKYKEIASLMDISEKTVEAQMTKALKIFRKKLM
jgi:RNA polymerase sigma-70 factor (ECF subfamily)